MTVYTPRHAGVASKHHGSPGYIACAVCSYRPKHAKPDPVLPVRPAGFRLRVVEGEAS